MSRKLHFALLSMACMSLASCELIGGIFKAGVWVGILAVVVVVALIIWIISRVGGKR